MSITNFYPGRCPKCRGDLVLEEQIDSLTDVVCKNCGFRIPLVIAPLSSGNAGEIADKFFKCQKKDVEKYEGGEYLRGIRREKIRIQVRRFRKKKSVLELLRDLEDSHH